MKCLPFYHGCLPQLLSDSLRLPDLEKMLTGISLSPKTHTVKTARVAIFLFDIIVARGWNRYLNFLETYSPFITRICFLPSSVSGIIDIHIS